MYDSDLTDAQWQRIKHVFAKQTFRKHNPRDLVNALFYLSKTGCQWRMLPQGDGSFPPWKTLYYHFRRWTASGLITRLHDALRRAVRVKAGRAPSPSAAIIDSQSVKTSHVGGPRSYDGGKNVTGRKRHIVTDTLGVILAVMVHGAGLADSQQAPHVLKRLLGNVPRLQVVFEEGQRGFVVLTKRWIVERTFAWFGGYRRLSKDYEYLPEVSEAMVLLCSIRMMVRRLA